MKSKKKAAALCIPGARWPEGQGPGAKICPWTPRGITRQTPDWLLMGGSNILSFWTGAPLMQEINQIYDQLRSFGPIFHEIPDMIFVHFCKCLLRFWQLLENTNLHQITRKFWLPTEIHQNWSTNTMDFAKAYYYTSLSNVAKRERQNDGADVCNFCGFPIN